MKRLAMVTLMLNVGVTSIYGQQRPVTGSFSGTAAPSTIVLNKDALGTGEYNFEGNGSLGSFSFRAFTSSAPAQKPLGSTCAIYGSVVAGAGVFRMQDGSLLMGNSAQGTDCIMFLPTGPVAYCTRIFKIVRGTGRFKNASGDTVKFAFTVLPVLFDTSGAPALSGITDGVLTGTISGVALGGGQQNEQD
jgi:hypothetical protein